MIRFYRTCLIVCALALVGGIVLADLVPSGRWHVGTNFRKDSPWIRHLWPPGRVGEPVTLDSGTVVIPIMIEPVYFDVIVPRSFETAFVRVTIATRPSTPVRVGVARKRNVWGAIFEDLHEESSSSQYWTGSATIALKGVSQENRRLQWILSAPGLIATHPLLIQSIDITFARPPLHHVVANKLRSLTK